MSARAEVFAALSKSGIPVAHMAWPKGSAPELPWCVFYLDDAKALFADDDFRCRHGTWACELYQESASSETEEAVEKAIHDAFGGYDKAETWVESEDCLMTVYRFTVVEGA